MRSPVTGMVDQFNALTEEQQKVFLDMVDPQPEPEQVKVKRTRKKKAEVPTAQKRGLPPAKADAPAVDSGWCVAKVPGLDVVCVNPEDNGIHDPNGGYGGYHPFVPPAQSAAKRSGRKGSGTNSGVSTEGEKEVVSAVGASGD